MDISEILNVVFGGGLVAALTALCTIGPTVRKAKAEAERARADAETVYIGNAENATRILMDNIVEPLKKELNATRREMARLRKAIDGANSCEHRNDCPVLDSMRGAAQDGDSDERRKRGQHAQKNGEPQDASDGAAVPGVDSAAVGQAG